MDKTRPAGHPILMKITTTYRPMHTTTIKTTRHQMSGEVNIYDTTNKEWTFWDLPEEKPVTIIGDYEDEYDFEIPCEVTKSPLSSSSLAGKQSYVPPELTKQEKKRILSTLNAGWDAELTYPDLVKNKKVKFTYARYSENNNYHKVDINRILPIRPNFQLNDYLIRQFKKDYPVSRDLPSPVITDVVLERVIIIMSKFILVKTFAKHNEEKAISTIRNYFTTGKVELTDVVGKAKNVPDFYMKYLHIIVQEMVPVYVTHNSAIKLFFSATVPMEQCKHTDDDTDCDECGKGKDKLNFFQKQALNALQNMGVDVMNAVDDDTYKEVISTVTEKVLDYMANSIETSFTNLGQWFSDIFKRIKEFFENNVINPIVDAYHTVTEAINKNNAMIWATMANFGTAVYLWLNDHWEASCDWMSQVYTAMCSAFEVNPDLETLEEIKTAVTNPISTTDESIFTQTKVNHSSYMILAAGTISTIIGKKIDNATITMIRSIPDTLGAMSELIKWALYKTTNDPVWKYGEIVIEMQNFGKRYHILSQDYKNDIKVLGEKQYVICLFELLEKGRQLEEKIALSDSNQAITTFRKNLAGVERLWDKVSRDPSNARDVPLFLYIYGGNGIGKSLMTTLFTNFFHTYLVAQGKSTGEFDESKIYVKDNSTEFWEGYIGQEIVLWPELFTQVDPAIKVGPAYTVLQMVSHEPFFPNMAFEQKGKVRFTSSVIIASSNAIPEEAARAGLQDPGAILRRMVPIRPIRTKHEIPASGACLDDYMKAWEFVFPDDVDLERTYPLLYKYFQYRTRITMQTLFDGLIEIMDDLQKKDTREKQALTFDFSSIIESKLDTGKKPNSSKPFVGYAGYKKLYAMDHKTADKEREEFAKTKPEFTSSTTDPHVTGSRVKNGAFTLTSFQGIFGQSLADISKDQTEIWLRKVTDYALGLDLLERYDLVDDLRGVFDEELTQQQFRIHFQMSRHLIYLFDNIDPYANYKQHCQGGEDFNWYCDIIPGTAPGFQRSTLEKMGVIGFVLGGIVAGSLLGFAIGKLINYILQQTMPEGQSETRTPSKKVMKGSEHAKRHFNKVDKHFGDSPVFQSQILPDHISIMSKVSANLRYMTYYTSSTISTSNWVLGIGGCQYLSVAHPFKHKPIKLLMSDGPSEEAGAFKEFNMSDVKLEYFKGLDMVMLTFDQRTISALPVITAHFNDTDKFPSKGIRSDKIICRGKINYIHSEVISYQDAGPLRVKDALKPAEEGTLYELFACHGVEGKAGDCGIPYFGVVDGKLKLLGLHSAGNHTCYMTIIPKGIKVTSPAATIVGHCKECVVSCVEGPYLEGVNFVGESKYSFSGTGESDIVFSPLIGKILDSDKKMPFEITKIPAIRKPRVDSEGNVHTPWEKNDKGRKGFKGAAMPSFVKEVWKYDQSLFTNYLDKFLVFEHDYRELTTEEVIFGCEYCNSINSSASLGYYGKVRGITDRNKLWNKETKWIEPQFKNDVDNTVEQLKGKDRVMFIVMQCIKDETLPIEDVKAYKARAFAICDLVQFVAVARLTTMACYTLKHNIGGQFVYHYNPHSFQAQQLYKEVMRYENVGNGDMSKHDLNFPQWICHLFAEYMCIRFYKVNEGSKEWNGIYNSVVSAVDFYWLRGKYLHQNRKGQSSGHFLTSILNSFCSYVCVVILWLFHYEENDLKYLALKVHGDDNIFTVSPRFPKFNLEYLSAGFMHWFGMCFTTADKKPHMLPYLLENPDFLSRTWMTHETGYQVHALNLSSICSMLTYVRKSEYTTLEESYQQNIDAASMELVYHGKEKYEQILGALSLLNRQLGFNFKFRNYKYWRTKWLLGWNNITSNKVTSLFGDVEHYY